MINGTQVAYAHIPNADNSLSLSTPSADEAAWVMLSDSLPAGFERGRINGLVGPGDTAGVAGAGSGSADSGGHGQPVRLNLDKLWDQNLTLTTRLVDSVTTPTLMQTVIAGQVKPRQLITYHFPLGDALKAYEAVGQDRRDHALKVIIVNE